jgi:hypothetical protein
LLQHPFQNVPLLLATGQGRSGTTVLTRSLAEHPLVYSNRVESNVMKDVLLAGHASSRMPSRRRQMVLPRDQHDLVFRVMLLHLLFPADLWNSPDPPLALSTFSAMNPAAAEFAVEVFPGIHFANIVRHGVEVVASRMVHRTLGQHAFEDHCRAWAAAREMAEWGTGRDDFTLIRHESLLESNSCADAFARLLVRAGLPDHSGCPQYVMENQNNQTQYAHEQEEPGEPGEPGCGLAGRQARWHHWTTAQRATFVEICGPAMDYFGYRIPQS